MIGVGTAYETSMVDANTPASQADDPFFRLTDDSEWNACIGRQGTEENYVDGYIEAAIELASAVIDKRLIGARDTLIMPILYNTRHALELSLKFVVSRLSAMGVVPLHPKNHDIMSHWKLLDGSVLGDEVLRHCVTALKPYVASLAQIDDDGQELRYPENRGGQQSLGDRSLANVAVIRRSLDELSEVMSRMKYRTLDFVDERNAGTFTQECSRSDLLAIARMLPPASDWREPVFDEAKARIAKRFGLSGRQFSAAVDQIKRNREIGALIGLEKDLVYLRDKSAMFVVEQWSKRHPPRADGDVLGTDYFTDRSREAFVEHARIARDVNQAVCGALTPDEIADMETIFYIGRDRVFCERYEAHLEATRKQHRAASHLALEVNHVLEKTNFLTCFAVGLAKLGRPSLAEQVLAIRPDQKPT